MISANLTVLEKSRSRTFCPANILVVFGISDTYFDKVLATVCVNRTPSVPRDKKFFSDNRAYITSRLIVAPKEG